LLLLLLLRCCRAAAAAAAIHAAGCTGAEHKGLYEWVDQVGRLILRAVAYTWQLNKLCSSSSSSTQ
jgi:hypothetical protein